ncbi:MAG: fimbrillin family protein [Rikenellaceae bacterium]
MKKILFSVAILAVAASCAKTEVVDIPQTNAISFSTLNDRITKAANDDNADYKVYATQSDITGAWFMDDYVSCGSAETAYSPETKTYYWPTDGSTLDFYAYAPKSSGTITPTVTPATAISIAYVVGEDADEDFTLAEPVKTQKAGTNEGVVNFEFAHMLSKVTVQVTLEEEFAEVYEISTSDDEAADAPFTATFAPQYDSFTVDVMAGAVDANVEASLSAVGTEYSLATSYMIAPQAFEDCTIQINGITIRHIGNGSTFFPSGVGVDLSTIRLTGDELSGGDAKFAAGTHYVFTVEISGSSTEEGEDPAVEITMTATTADWDENDDYNSTLTQD